MPIKKIKSKEVELLPFNTQKPETITGPILPYFSGFQYFQLLYGSIPNEISAKEAKEEIKDEFNKFKLLKEFTNCTLDKTEPGDLIFDPSMFFSRKDKAELREIENGIIMLLGFDRNRYNIFYTDEKRNIARELASKFQEKYGVPKNKDNKHKIFLLFCNQGSYYLKDHDLSSAPEIDIELNYGEKFVLAYKDLLEKLEKEDTGLFLFFSQPGTGKTSLIRHLINTLPNQKIVFIPPNYASALSDPSFLPFIADEDVSLIVVEDAEDVLRSREEGNSSASGILNLTDGILGDVLKIKILATFNTSKELIDSALMRKGRLKFSYEFGALKATEADKLLNSLGFPPQNKPMTLAEIYNFGVDNGVTPKEVRKLGFGV